MSESKKIGEFEPELVNVYEWPPEVLAAFNSAVNGELTNDDFARLPASLEHVVLLVIDGKRLSFRPFVEAFVASFDAEVDRAARRIAEERLRPSAVADRLSRLNDVIDRTLDELFPGTRSDD